MKLKFYALIALCVILGLQSCQKDENLLMDQDVTDNIENNSQNNGEISARSSDCGDLSGFA